MTISAFYLLVTNQDRKLKFTSVTLYLRPVSIYLRLGGGVVCGEEERKLPIINDASYSDTPSDNRFRHAAFFFTNKVFLICLKTGDNTMATITGIPYCTVKGVKMLVVARSKCLLQLSSIVMPQE